ncbi:Glycerophosphoryl diester phosphodiesterase family-domain-containing protein, partial [Podospora fimiseda]
LDEAFYHDLRQVDAFARRQGEVIQFRIEALQDHYGVSPSAADFPWPILQQAATAELEDIKASVAEIQEEIIWLDWYKKVNQDALDKIRLKQDINSRQSSLRGQSSVVNLAASPTPSKVGIRVKADADFLHRIIILVGRQDFNKASEKPIFELDKILNQFPASEQWVLSHKDALGRAPLHYAAAYGLARECQDILSSMTLWGWTASRKSRAILAGDSAGETPLDLAVQHGHAAAEKLLLEELEHDVHDTSVGHLLFTAINPDSRMFSQHFCPPILGCTCIATIMEKLLFTLPRNMEKFRWCAHFCLPVLTPMRRRMYGDDSPHHRNYPGASSSGSNSCGSRLVQGPQVQDRAQASSTNQFSGYDSDYPTSLSRFQSHIFVHLGALYVYDPANAVDIAPYQAEIAPAVIHSTSLFLQVFLRNPTQYQNQQPAPPYLCQLPILEDLLRGVLGTERESLKRHHAIPLIGSRGQLVGTVTFIFMVVEPFGSQKPPPTFPPQIQRSSSTLVGAHRGLGMNTKQRTQLQISENTLQSLLSSLDAGAHLVEFDVQVTKDGVSVIYHDILVSETGTDIPMHSLTLEQFLAISKEQSGPLQRRRASSVHEPRDDGTKFLIERMKHTLIYKILG